jgi:Circularly permutated YpsA SLOG family
VAGVPRAAGLRAIDRHYQLKGTPSANYVQRTEWNARDSDGTVVFSIGGVLTGGSKKTVELARKHGRPVLHLSKATAGVSGAEAALWLFVEEHGIRVLNVAGPRAAKEPEVAAFVKGVLDRTWPTR